MPIVGCVFSVVRTSLHDGPGVRTVVYMKGCNMHCAWCHNPEGFSPEPQIMLYRQRCIDCGRCMLICPEHHLLVDGVHDHLQDGCIGCGKCVDACPSTALKLCGSFYTPDALMKIIEKDIHYYQKSGGGITFSGGECLLQAEFLVEILKRCHEAGIHTLIETALHVPWKNVQLALEYTDAFYVDLKLMDAAQHKKYTGCSNTVILKNLKALSEVHKDIIVRIPMIPCVNDDMQNLAETCEFASKLDGVRGVMLLRYNPMAESKYLRAKCEYTSFGTETQSIQQMKAFCDELNGKLSKSGFVFCKD